MCFALHLESSSIKKEGKKKAPEKFHEFDGVLMCFTRRAVVTVAALKKKRGGGGG